MELEEGGAGAPLDVRTLGDPRVLEACGFVRPSHIMSLVPECGKYAEQPHPVTHYWCKTPNNRRMELDIAQMRYYLAHRAARDTDLDGPFFGGPSPLFEQALCSNYTTINECDPRWTWRKRFVLDIDGERTDQPVFVDIDALLAWVMQWAQHHVSGDVDWGTEPYVLLGGSFGQGDKAQSFHLYFPMLCFKSGKEYVPVERSSAHLALQEKLDPYGLKYDCKINTGLIYPFMTKLLDDGSTRRAVKVVVRSRGVDLSTWYKFFATCDPLMLPADRGYDREIELVNGGVVHNAPNKRPRVAEHLPTVHEVVRVADNSQFEERLRAVFPDIPADALFEAKERYAHTYVLQSTYCPLKDGHHKEPGRFYCVVHNDNTIDLHCFKANCVGRKLVPADAHQDVIEDVRDVWTKVGSSALLNASLDHPFRQTILCSREQMQQHARSNALNVKYPPLKIGKREVSAVQYWFERELHHYDQLYFAPPPLVCPPSFFNTYRGMDTRVMEIAETYMELPVDELLSKFQWTAHHILRNICNGLLPVYEQFMGFFADIVANPGAKPKWAVGLYGQQGAGKGQTVQFFGKIFGERLFAHLDARSLDADFNGGIMEKLLLFSDEGISSDSKHGDAMLKKLITETMQTVRRKYANDYDIETCFRVVAASNDPPAWINPGDRRWLAVRADFRTAADGTPEFVDLMNKVAQERETLVGVAAFVALALRGHWRESFNPNAAMMTQEKAEIVEQKFTPVDNFWLAVCRKELALPASQCAHGAVQNSRIYEEFVYTLRESEKAKWTVQKFWNGTHSLIPKKDFETQSRKFDGKNAMSSILPDISHLRKCFCSFNKLPPSYFPADDPPE